MANQGLQTVMSQMPTLDRLGNQEDRTCRCPQHLGSVCRRGLRVDPPREAWVVLVWTVTPRYASRTCAYRARWLAWCVQFAFGISTGLAVLGIWISQRASGVGLGMQYPAGHVRELLFVWAAFLLNGMAPYLGLKTEFSFAMFSNLRCEPWRHLVIPASWRPFRAWRYVALETITGLPQPAQLQNDPAAHLSLHLLSQADAYVYTPYFLRKGIERLLAVAPAARIQLRFSDATGHYDVDTRDGGGLSKLSRGLPMNLFPFVLPRSADAPHSEQGSVLKSKGERQLF